MLEATHIELYDLCETESLPRADVESVETLHAEVDQVLYVFQVHSETRNDGYDDVDVDSLDGLERHSRCERTGEVLVVFSEVDGHGLCVDEVQEALYVEPRGVGELVLTTPALKRLLVLEHVVLVYALDPVPESGSRDRLDVLLLTVHLFLGHEQVSHVLLKRRTNSDVSCDAQKSTRTRLVIVGLVGKVSDRTQTLDLQFTTLGVALGEQPLEHLAGGGICRRHV